MKPLEILLTNDDSYTARGINVAAEFLRRYGNVTVVAPLEPQSGKSVSLTLRQPMYLDLLREEPGLRFFTLTGTPADCVKMGVKLLSDEGKFPGLLVSGINHGSNASSASLYSGTLGAAAEGTIYGIPSVGLSIDTHDPEADFSGVLAYLERIFDQIFNHGFDSGVYLNVNFPDTAPENIAGIRFARQGRGRWVKEYEPYRDAEGRDCYIMVGEFNDLEDGPCEPGQALPGDHKAVQQNYITIVPHLIDSTDYREAERLRGLWQLD